MVRAVRPENPIAETEISEHLEAANYAALLMVLFQLTGDRHWLEEPYLPSRTKGLGDNRTAGLSPELQQNIRSAALDAIIKWHNGVDPAESAPRGELLMRMMSSCVGETVPAEYESMAATEMGFADAPVPQQVAGELSAIIIGAGVSGLLAAEKLAAAGIPFTVLDKNDDVGGTWLQNRYPGCGVDTPSQLYSLAAHPHSWSRHFAKRDEVLAYLRDVANSTDDACVHTGVEVYAAEYDATRRIWVVSARTTSGPRTYEAPILISAVGQLDRPNIPSIEGARSYRGEIFHSANWPKDHSLEGKRVAVVGSAASAMQIVPAIADKVPYLAVFQRSPQWIAPCDNYFDAIGEDANWLMANVPFYHEWYRFRLAWIYTDKVHPSLQVDPQWEDSQRSVNATNDAHRRVFTDYLRTELAGCDELIENCLPTYPPFGKRMLLDNRWFATLRRDNVELISEPVTAITETGVTTPSGEHRDVDVVVLATGFQAQRFLSSMEIRGKSGLTLRETWNDDDPRAYLGITVPDFPNLFIMYGPNTSLGHGGSYIYIAECQINYIVDAVVEMAKRGAVAIECRPIVNEEYNKRVDEAHAQMIYSHGAVSSYYRNHAGRVVTNSPWRVVDYWRMTRKVDLTDFDVTVS